MKLFIVFLLAVTTGALEEWDLFKANNEKHYTTEAEEQKRIEIFLRNKLFIEEHNKNYENGLASYRLKMNWFGDMLQEEVEEMMKQYENNYFSNGGNIFVKSINLELPESLDWREKGAVSNVQSQGRSCRSSWAFSAIGSLESQQFLKTNTLVQLSVQNLLDCSDNYGNNGCSGGMAGYAFNYIRDNGGIDDEASYPYEGHKDFCRYKSSYSRAEAKGYTNIPMGDEDALQEAVATIGPIAAVVDASQLTFVQYDGGIYYSEDCKSEKASHSVLIVGYGVEDGNEFWLVKNSWGTDWGENGYIRMAKDKNNNCGIASWGTYPIV